MIATRKISSSSNVSNRDTVVASFQRSPHHFFPVTIVSQSYALKMNATVLEVTINEIGQPPPKQP